MLSAAVAPLLFEGSEKVLEIWFKNTSCHVDVNGLRLIPRETWAAILALVRCQILSHTGNEYCDAYVLSESSLFVYPHKMILKTCGTTTLLHAVEPLLRAALTLCGLSEIDDVFYSRKNFLFPQAQSFPHSSFVDECTALDKHFKGSGYQLGRTNGDHWFLYTTDRESITSTQTAQAADETLELLMTGLDTCAAQDFFAGKQTTSSAMDMDMAQVGGRDAIAALVPGAQLDDFQFDPCGYSVNGLIGESYFTIHVTPQPSCSYASFETNLVLPREEMASLIRRVVSIFRPKSCFVTLFANQACLDPTDCAIVVPAELLSGMRRRTKTLYEFENSYKLLFAHYGDAEQKTLS